MLKEIWLDADGVLLDWTRPFLEFIKTKQTYDDLTQYDLSYLFDPLTYLGEVIVSAQQQKINAIHDFHLQAVYERLPSMANVEDLKRLKEMGYVIHCITAVEDEPLVRRMRLQNLTDNFSGLIDDVVFTLPGQCKLSHIRSHRPHGDVIIVEDNPTLLKTANDLVADELGPNQLGRTNIFAFAIMHPYNIKEVAHLPFVVQVDTLKEVVDIIQWKNKHVN